MREGLKKIKVKLQRSYNKKEDLLKKYKLSSKMFSSKKVEFMDDRLDAENDENIFNEDNGIIFVNKTFFNKIRIEYIDKKALRYLGPIFISSIVLGFITGIIFYF